MHRNSYRLKQKVGNIMQFRKILVSAVCVLGVVSSLVAQSAFAQAPASVPTAASAALPASAAPVVSAAPEMVSAASAPAAATPIAATAGALSWMLAEWFVRSKPSLLGLCLGLVATTPAAGFVSPRSALVFGVAAGVACYWGATSLKRALDADDSRDVFGVHGVAGLVGALLTVVFASKTISGNEGSLLTQAIGAGAVLLYSLFMTGAGPVGDVQAGQPAGGRCVRDRWPRYFATC